MIFASADYGGLDLAPSARRSRRRIASLLGGIIALALGLYAIAAHAQTGAPNNCSGSVGASAAALSFPAAGSTGNTFPSQYLTIQNIHATQNLGVNAMPGGTAAIGSAGTFTLSPGATMSWHNPQFPPPSSVSVIGSGAATVFTCAYR